MRRVLDRTEGALVVCLVLAAAGIAAYTFPPPTGDWEGESMCVDRAHFPACKDEHVLYRFGSGPKPGKPFILPADKLVAGKFERMGEIELRYDPQRGDLFGEFQNRKFHGRWEFHVQGTRITGRLFDLASKRTVRKIEVRKKP